MCQGEMHTAGGTSELGGPELVDPSVQQKA